MVAPHIIAVCSVLTIPKITCGCCWLPVVICGITVMKTSTLKARPEFQICRNPIKIAAKMPVYALILRLYRFLTGLIILPAIT